MSDGKSLTPEAADKLKSRKRVLSVVHLAVCGLVVATMAVASVQADPGGESFRGMPIFPLVMVCAVAAVLVLTLMWLRWWRCPECNRYLGRVFGIHFCPHCGVGLQ